MPIDINYYPAVKKHLDKYWDKISIRDDYGDTPYNLRNCIYTDLFLEQNIVWQRITHENTFCVTKNGYCILDSMAFINCSNSIINYLLGILNSSLAYFYFKSITTSYGDTGFRLSNQFVELFPVPKKKSDDINILVNGIIKDYNNYLQNEIEQQVSDIYNLNRNEIKYIDEFYCKYQSKL